MAKLKVLRGGAKVFRKLSTAIQWMQNVPNETSED